MRARLRVILTVASTLLALLFAAAAPAAAATNVIRLDGTAASAEWYSDPSACIVSTAFASGVTQTVAMDRDRQTTTNAYVGIARFDQCTGMTLFSAYGSAPAFFEIDTKL
jgi:hypothetical protein